MHGVDGQKRSRYEGYLAMADRHVLESERHIRQQIALIQRLDEHCCDNAPAKTMLRMFEESLRSHIAHPDEFRSVLKELNFG
jgi:hypothetical protein